MRFCKIILVFIVNFKIVFTFGQIQFPKMDILYLYSACVIKSADNTNARGICTKLDDCFDIRFKVENSVYNHTVCGYEGKQQIVCCPWQVIYDPMILAIGLPEIGIPLINLPADYKCTVKSSEENGVLKFIEDCPELNGNMKAGEQDLCNHEICKGLVCCPSPAKTSRYNPVCANVDQPDTEIKFRLDVNTPCQVKGLNNVTGTYQISCEPYTRKAISEDNAVAVCFDETCINYYCCPVIEPDDVKMCRRRGKPQFPRIEFVGPKCIDSVTKLPGRCRRIVDCPAFIEGREIMDECGVDCCTTFYCCPEENYEFETISMQKCFGYRNTVYRKQVTLETLYEAEPPNELCSQIYQPHAGGIRAIPGAFPHMAALGYTSKEDSNKLLWNCGGSLISEKYVLTAAHCLVPRQFGQMKQIRLGSLYLDNVTKPDECAEDFGVKRVIPHPSYNRSYVYNDIGIIELDREVKFNFHMRPICLPTSAELPYSLIGMGWGLLGPGGEKSETLYYGYLETYTYDECNQSYAFNLNRRVLNGIDDETQLCVGSRETISSSCTGDSGGPIMASHEDYANTYQIFGVTSFGTVCGFANSPGVYTKVYPYIKWIESIVWPK